MSILSSPAPGSIRHELVDRSLPLVRHRLRCTATGPRAALSTSSYGASAVDIRPFHALRVAPRGQLPRAKRASCPPPAPPPPPRTLNTIPTSGRGFVQLNSFPHPPSRRNHSCRVGTICPANTLSVSKGCGKESYELGAGLLRNVLRIATSNFTYHDDKYDSECN